MIKININLFFSNASPLTQLSVCLGQTEYLIWPRVRFRPLCGRGFRNRRSKNGACRRHTFPVRFIRSSTRYVGLVTNWTGRFPFKSAINDTRVRASINYVRNEASERRLEITPYKSIEIESNCLAVERTSSKAVREA